MFDYSDLLADKATPSFHSLSSSPDHCCSLSLIEKGKRDELRMVCCQTAHDKSLTVCSHSHSQVLTTLLHYIYKKRCTYTQYWLTRTQIRWKKVSVEDWTMKGVGVLDEVKFSLRNLKTKNKSYQQGRPVLLLKASRPKSAPALDRTLSQLCQWWRSHQPR